jgi:hypothetical protein
MLPENMMLGAGFIGRTQSPKDFLSFTVQIVTDLLKALLSNGSVSGFKHTRHATVEVFYVVSATQQWNCFLCGLRHIKIEELCFLCGPRHATVEELCFQRGPCRVYITGVCM